MERSIVGSRRGERHCLETMFVGVLVPGCRSSIWTMAGIWDLKRKVLMLCLAMTIAGDLLTTFVEKSEKIEQCKTWRQIEARRRDWAKGVPKLKTVRYFLKGSDPNYQFCRQVIFNRSEEALQTLKTLTPCVTTECDAYTSPLHWVVANGMGEVAKLLLGRGANIEALSSDDHTPLLVAVRYNQPNLAQILLESCADTTDQHHNGKTPLLDAVLRHNVPMVKLLLPYSLEALYLPDNQNNTPILVSEKIKPHAEIHSLLLEAEAYLSRLRISAAEQEQTVPPVIPVAVIEQTVPPAPDSSQSHPELIAVAVTIPLT